MRAIFDTETTGIPLRETPSDHPDQPQLVQFAAILLDNAGAERMTVNVIVKPNGWEIPAEVTAIHGITTEMAMLYGIPEATVVRLFVDLIDHADIVVAAHNDGYDWRLMRIAMLRAGMSREECDAIKEKCQRICTMRLAYHASKANPAGKLKWPPSVSACMAHFFNETHDKAHDAMADVRACSRIWQAVLMQQATGAAV